MELQACCGTCLKPLQKGVHKGKEQLWALGIAAMFLKDPAYIDLADLELRGDLIGPTRPTTEGLLPSYEEPMAVVLSEDILGRTCRRMLLEMDTAEVGD